MKDYKRILISALFSLFFGLNTMNGQSIKEDQTNAEYVKVLIDLPEVERVFIVAVNKYFEYDKDWLDNVIISGNFIAFKSLGEGKLHTWDLNSMIMVEKYQNIIKVRLSNMVGE